MENFDILLEFLLITIALLIAVSIYCYLIKYRAKQKHLLPFHGTNNELKILCINDVVIKNETYHIPYYQYKKFDPNNIKINEKSHENILIYYIGYVTIKDSKYVNLLYLIFSKVNGCFKKLMEISI